MKVTQLTNGQIEVKSENLTLTHTHFEGLGFKSNDCMIDKGEYYEIVPSSDERFKPLFVALVNFKNANY